MTQRFVLTHTTSAGFCFILPYAVDGVRLGADTKILTGGKQSEEIVLERDVDVSFFDRRNGKPYFYEPSLMREKDGAWRLSGHIFRHPDIQRGTKIFANQNNVINILFRKEGAIAVGDRKLGSDNLLLKPLVPGPLTDALLHLIAPLKP